MTAKPLIGIDLGTTNSLISAYIDDKVQIIPNQFAHNLTPSAISVDDNGTILVGLAARERLSTHPESSVTAFKRWMGTDKVIKLGKNHFRAEELSSLLLQSLRRDAEAFLNQTIEDVVITVPAYFNSVQRTATQAAAKIAGLNVTRLLNEPTAAGLAYGLQEKTDETTFLIFDLGGGTFDVSILEYFDGVVQVLSSAGDTQLGGEDFLHILKQIVFRKEPQLAAIKGDKAYIDNSLWRSLEQLKRDLTLKKDAIFEYAINEQEYAISVSRSEFEHASKPLLSKIRQPIERALRDAKLNPATLDGVILVGGATRMPLVREMILKLFRRLPLQNIHPDETIAYGAAIQAALVARDVSLTEVILTDVMPYSLGIAVCETINNQLIDNRFSPIIERNMPVPISRISSYSTIQDNQTEISVRVLQGESPIASDNLKLGEMQISIPAKPKGEVSIDVRFTYDANGLLHVDISEEIGSQHLSQLFKQNENSLTEAEISVALEKMQTLKIHPKDEQQNIYVMERAKRLYSNRLGNERDYIQQCLGIFEQALNTQDEREIKKARAEFSEILDRLDDHFIL